MYANYLTLPFKGKKHFFVFLNDMMDNYKKNILKKPYFLIILFFLAFFSPKN